MSLASAEVKHPAQLRADIQQYYGLNLDGMGSAYSYEHAAALVANLPRSSRIASILNEANEWADNEYILRSIDYTLRLISWQIGGGKGRAPEPLPTPQQVAERRRKITSTDRAFIDSILKGDSE